MYIPAKSSESGPIYPTELGEPIDFVSIRMIRRKRTAADQHTSFAAIICSPPMLVPNVRAQLASYNDSFTKVFSREIRNC